MHPVITASDCIGCGACIDACPAGVIELQDNVCTVVNEGDCIGCANCQDECPVGAITEIAEYLRLSRTSAPPKGRPGNRAAFFVPRACEMQQARFRLYKRGFSSARRAESMCTGRT